MLNVAGRYVYLKPGRDPRFCIASISCCVLLPVSCMPCPDVENKALSALPSICVPVLFRTGARFECQKPPPYYITRVYRRPTPS